MVDVEGALNSQWKRMLKFVGGWEEDSEDAYNGCTCAECERNFLMTAMGTRNKERLQFKFDKLRCDSTKTMRFYNEITKWDDRVTTSERENEVM